MAIDDTITVGEAGHVEHHIALAQAINTQPVVGQELAYAERVTQDTTTALPSDNTTLMANVISGLSCTVTGLGRPVEVEAFVPVATHSAATGVIYLHIMQDGAQVVMTNVRPQGAGTTVFLLIKRRLIIPDGVTTTFNVAKSLDVSGTGTYYAATDCPMYLSVVQR
jgi:hypothetical protein